MSELILYTPKQVHEKLNISYETVMRHIRGYRTVKGERVAVDILPTKQFTPGKYLIEHNDLMAFLNRFNNWPAYQATLPKKILKKPK